MIKRCVEVLYYAGGEYRKKCSIVNDSSMSGMVQTSTAHDYRKYLFTIAYIWFDCENKDLFSSDSSGSSKHANFADVIRAKQASQARKQDLALKGIETQPEENFDYAFLSIVIFGVILSLLNISILVKLIWRHHNRSLSVIFASISSANLLHLICLLVFIVERRYDMVALNWVATMTISFSNWCFLPSSIYVIIDAYFNTKLSSWASVKVVFIQLLILLGLSCFTPIPGVAEVNYFTNEACYNTSNPGSGCWMNFDSLIFTQTRVLPVIVHGIPPITTMIFLMIALNRYKPAFVIDMTTNSDAAKHKFTNGSLSAMLTASWYVVYSLPTAILILTIQAGDSYDDQIELRSSKSMIKLAMVFRILNTTANFFMNLICMPQFRTALFSKRERLPQTGLTTDRESESLTTNHEAESHRYSIREMSQEENCDITSAVF